MKKAFHTILLVLFSATIIANEGDKDSTVIVRQQGPDKKYFKNKTSNKRNFAVIPCMVGN
ncbi:MAG TPA: hypothetical protein PLC65_00505 [Bacteroidia bacterium]|nr:hypothetical protein [Bacteroidia bacterium]